MAIFVAAMGPILSTPILPLIDFYNHLARYFVLANLADTPFLQQNYASNWSMLPNIGVDILGTGLLKILPPIVAGHVIFIFILTVLYSGVIFLHRKITGHYYYLVPILVTPLLYSYIFTWGFANFLLGMGLVFWAAGWWLSMRHRPLLAVPVACLLAISIFLAHGLAFALYGLLVGALELGVWLNTSNRRLGGLAKSMAMLAVQAVLPTLMFLSTATADSAQGLTNADESVRSLSHAGLLWDRLFELCLYRLQTVVRVAEGPSLWFDALTFVATIGLLVAMGIKGRLALHRTAWPALAIGALLVAIAPPAMFGVGYVADRMPLFLAFIAIASLAPRPGAGRADRLMGPAITALVAARLVYIGVDWQQYREDFAEFQSVARMIPADSLTASVIVTLKKRADDGPRYEMYGPLLVAAYGQAGPLFAHSTQQPLKLVGGLKAAVKATPKARGLGDKDAPRFYSHWIREVAAADSFGYLLVCRADRLAEPFPAQTRVIARTRRFTLLQIQR